MFILEVNRIYIFFKIYYNYETPCQSCYYGCTIVPLIKDGQVIATDLLVPS